MMQMSSVKKRNITGSGNAAKVCTATGVQISEATLCWFVCLSIEYKKGTCRGASRYKVFTFISALLDVSVGYKD